MKLPVAAILAALMAVCNLASGAVTREVIVGGFSQPLHVTAPPGDPNRLFVVQRTGTIRIINLSNNTINPTAFLNVNDAPGTNVSATGEGGLLSMAFHPEYALNGYFYVYYTTIIPSIGFSTRVSRFTVSSNPHVADPASEVVFFELDQNTFSNHKGGQIAFRLDDENHYLYVALGDGGGACDPFLAGQDLDSKLGKILRIDVDRGPSGDVGNPHAPPTNPFVGVPGDDLIWTLGLRNPFRFNFDRLTGDMYIGDVGQDSREEIDYEPGDSAGGLNFGWNAREGGIAAPCGTVSPTLPEMIDPITEYSHGGGGTSIIGGSVYRGSQFATLYGRYFFADFDRRLVWSCRRSGNGITDLQEHTAVLNPNNVNIVAFGEDAHARLYMVEPAGTIVRITDPASPVADADADGVFDSYETDTGTYVSPTNTGTDPGAADSDGDGFLDSLEVADGTNPNLAGSNLPREHVYIMLGGPAPRLGTIVYPATTLTAAVPVVEEGGTIHFLNTGNSNEPITLNKAMTLTSENGSVVIGAP